MTESNENLIKALGIESLPDDQKARILDQSATMVEQRLLLRLMKTLTDAKRDELSKVLASNDKTQLDEFVAAEAPDFPDWVAEETEVLKQELKDIAGEEI